MGRAVIAFKCDVCDKLAFTTRAQGINAALRKSRRYGSGFRVYREARCGYFHLTRQSRRQV